MRKRRHGKVSSAWIRPELRWAIYLRDHFTCIWCAAPLAAHDLTLDHIFPRSSPYRTNRPARLLTSCRACNLSRKDSPIAGWLRARYVSAGEYSATLARVRAAMRRTVDRAAGASVYRLLRVPRPVIIPSESDLALRGDGYYF